MTWTFDFGIRIWIWVWLPNKLLGLLNVQLLRIRCGHFCICCKIVTVLGSNLFEAVNDPGHFMLDYLRSASSDGAPTTFSSASQFLPKSGFRPYATNHIKTRITHLHTWYAQKKVVCLCVIHFLTSYEYYSWYITTDQLIRDLVSKTWTPMLNGEMVVRSCPNSRLVVFRWKIRCQTTSAGRVPRTWTLHTLLINSTPAAETAAALAAAVMVFRANAPPRPRTFWIWPWRLLKHYQG